MAPRYLILSLLLFLPLAAFPIPSHLHPSLPRLPRRPHLRIHETTTHIFATLSHPSLNETSTARVTLSINPLTVRIDPLLGRPLKTTIPLTKTFTNVSIDARPGSVELTLKKTAPFLEAEVSACGISRTACLERIAKRVCIKVHLPYALTTLPCNDRCAVSVLQKCQRVDLFAEGAAMLTQIVFAAVACIMLLTFGWGFASAIASIPKEVERLGAWCTEIFERIRGERFKTGFMEILNEFVL